MTPKLTSARPYSYINYEGSLLTVKAQHGCCFDTVIGTIICDPYDGAQHLINPETLDDAIFIADLKRIAASNDWQAYYQTRPQQIIPLWVWSRIWIGYSTISSLPYGRLKIDRD